MNIFLFIHVWDLLQFWFLKYEVLTHLAQLLRRLFFNLAKSFNFQLSINVIDKTMSHSIRGIYMN